MTGRQHGAAAGVADDGISYRPGGEDDLLPSAGVFKRALNGHYGKYNLPLVEAPDAAFVPLHRHILRQAGPRFWVAEADGEMIGFGAGIVRGDLWYLAALFVLPDVQGRGVGGTLLRRARTDAPAGGLAATITDALQPVSNTLYARHGLLPWLPVLGLQGKAPDGAATPPRACELVKLDPSLLEEVRALDGAVTGLDRTPEHLFYLSEEGGREGWLLFRRGRPAGYVYVSQRGLVGPAAARRHEDMAVLMHSALSLMRERGVEDVYVPVPGPNRDAQRVLLAAGFTFEACPGMLLASREFGRFDRYIIANYGLM